MNIKFWLESFKGREQLGDTNIETELEQIGWDDVKCIEIGQDRGQWGTFMTGWS
jgi:hypothetical protein